MRLNRSELDAGASSSGIALILARLTRNHPKNCRESYPFHLFAAVSLSRQRLTLCAKLASGPNGMTAGFGYAQPERSVDSRLTIRDFRAVTLTPALEPADDSALVIAAREGDRSAFGGLYARYARMVHGILLARVPSHDVDDLVQDVFL